MFIARWHLTANFGKLEDCVSLLKRWQIDVGERIGWKVASVRVTTGSVGAPPSALEYEVTFDSLSDLESAWNDLEKAPHHREYMKMFEGLMAPGSGSWTIHRQIDIAPND
jgi:hypothetical protein